MKQITEKQIVEWKAELNVQKQKKVQAEQALDEITRTILMIEGGIQFGEIVLKKTEQVIPSSHKEEPNQQSIKAPSKK
tara:strand:+ start:354 stop:587 length:234 start_codon:yes stop_codon:yes gene_type:complete